MNAKERLKRIIRAQNSLLKAKTHLQLAQNSIRKEYELCVREAAAADGFVADCDERIERAGSWDGAQPDAYFGKLIKWRRCDNRDFGRLVRVSLDPIADPLQQPEAKLIGIDYGPDGDIESFQCEGSKGQAVHWKAAWVQLQDDEELEAPPNGRTFARIHIGFNLCTESQPKDGSLWDVIAEKWHIRPLDLVYLVPPAKWAQWPTWSTLHDLVLRNHRFVIDPEAEVKVSDTGEIAIKVIGLWVNADWLHVDHSFRAKAAQLLAKDCHWEPSTFGEALLATKPPESGPEVNAKDHFAGANKMVAEEPAPPSLATVAGQDGRETREISPGDWVYIHEAYRDVTPADVGKLVYVRNGELEQWIELRLAEVTGADFPYRCTKDGLDPSMWQAFRYACIRNEKPASSPIGDGYRRATRADLGKQCEFSDGSTNADGSLVWGIFARLMAFTTDPAAQATKWHTEKATYYDCRVKVEG